LPTPSDKQIVTVDVVLLTIVDQSLGVGLIERVNEPQKGARSLIGGYVHADKDADTDATAARVLREKAGLHGFFLEQLATFSGATRDPRGWSVSVAYLALTPYAWLNERTGAENLIVAPLAKARPLAFDHERILAAAVARLRGKGAYSTLPASLLPETFTFEELLDAYRIALGAPTLDAGSFRRRVEELSMLEPMGAGRDGATLYRLTPGAMLFDRRI
jgi:8-oxo-dGTP diphosphatase